MRRGRRPTRRSRRAPLCSVPRTRPRRRQEPSAWSVVASWCVCARDRSVSSGPSCGIITPSRHRTSTRTIRRSTYGRVRTNECVFCAPRSGCYRVVMLEDVDVKRGRKRSRRKMRPKDRVAMAGLEDAVRRLQHYAVANDRATRALVAEIDAWFACDDCDHPFTFASICTVLALNIAYARSGFRDEGERQQVTLRAAPRVLRLTDRRRFAGRRTPSHLRAVPLTSPTRVAAASSARPPAPSPQPVRTASETARNVAKGR